MKESNVLIVAPLVLGLLALTAWAGETPEAFFRAKVAPILVGRCLECHAETQKGGLDLRTRSTALKGGESGAVVEPGAPDRSLLYEYVSTAQMPPDNPLDEKQVEVLKQWIARGMPFFDEPLNAFSITTDRRAGYDFWSLQPLAEPQLPSADNTPLLWRKNEIDHFVFAELSKRNLSPSPPATPRVLIRRATYDLTGLPPAPSQVGSFLDECETETGSRNTVGQTAYEKLLDRLLASPRYGERWGQHWLDVVRFGESSGFERNILINNLWPFRDYVINSLNDNKRFDQFIMEHMAGDIVGPGKTDREIGTAFLVCGPYDNVMNQDPVQVAQIRSDTIDEIIRATGEAFLGLTFGCSRCHDHKFDAISQQDYYSLYATFAGVQHGSRIIATPKTQREHEAILAPLHKRRKELGTERSQLQKTILARAKHKEELYNARWTRPPVDRTLTEETFSPVSARMLRLISEGSETSPDNPKSFYLDELEIWTVGGQPRNVALAKHGALAQGAGREAKDARGAYGAQLTIDGKYGAPWHARDTTLTITFAQEHTINRVVFSSNRLKVAGTTHTNFLCEYRIEVSTDGHHWTEVINSYDRRPLNNAHRRHRLLNQEKTDAEHQLLAKLDKEWGLIEKKISAVPPLLSWWAGSFEQVTGPFHVLLGGDSQRKGEEVQLLSPKILERSTQPYQLTPDAGEAQRRGALANWIVAADNPLTPRVLANRLWHYHFGKGIVATPSDFGFMGQRPTHPPLLDWLARKLQRPTKPNGKGGFGWRLKPMHKLIMLSQTYRQSSTYQEQAARIDASTRWLWRFPPRRLSGEEIRDTHLFVVGMLDLRMGGPGFRLYDYRLDNVATYVPLDHHDPATYRRAIYHQNARAARVDLMTDFDSPDCVFAEPRRNSTTTPLQALTLLNHSFTMDMAEHLAQRLRRETGSADPDAQLRRAFELAFCRSPVDRELTAGVQLIESHGLQAFCRVLLNTSELVYVN